MKNDIEIVEIKDNKGNLELSIIVHDKEIQEQIMNNTKDNIVIDISFKLNQNDKQDFYDYCIKKKKNR